MTFAGNHGRHHYTDFTLQSCNFVRHREDRKGSNSHCVSVAFMEPQAADWVGWTLLDSVGSQISSQIVGTNSTTVNQWGLQAEGHLFFFLVLSLLSLCVRPFFPLHYILFCLHILFKTISFVPMVSPVPTSLETPAGLHEWSFMFHIAQTQCSPHTFLSLV